MNKSVKENPLYFVDRSISPHVCLPSSVDISKLLDVSEVSNAWARYLDTSTDKIYDCAACWEEMQQAK